MSNIVCFGEVLWDVFPEHKKIGGAPLNVALRLASFEHNVSMISAVGHDELGTTLLKFVEENNINTEHVQKLEDFKTGDVQVVLSDKGSASYTIEYPRAWDKITVVDAAVLTVKNADAFVFGSLATRDAISKQTLYDLIEVASYKIFDLNLRPPFYNIDILIYLMNKADFIKFNDDELFEVSAYLGSKFNGLEQNLMLIAEKTNTKHICVTKGSHGAVLLYDNQLYYNSGYQIEVKDTVGAGDSFLASLVSQLLNNIEPQMAINFASAVGALVAEREGANPKLSTFDIETFINPK
ncbi:carbohydrate kinase [Tamlana sp. 2_MG-2023]|uniref:carbohydrate kinase family protein n=1 Tax=unclassified Tamlana TaxID=2614803 RepID=UPI0026E2A510|nr:MULTISPECIES: carbohydrate kinase [unclassified Tamlana]MDO6758709.1 carbohydrate kinase [Tamlana sp. 2_MG-2023]MDO6789408.1 carbohydrate kinase [Tamlana sp. 1_MG-2023]